MSGWIEIYSVFRIWAIAIVAFLLLFSTCFLAGAIVFTLDADLTSILIYGAMFLLFVFIWLWLFFGELRRKLIKVTLRNREMEVAGFAGWGKKYSYNFSDLDGFFTVQMPTRYRTYEYLFITSQGKLVARLSEYYHKNYFELKAFLSEKLQDMGEKKFSLTTEVVDIFK